MSSSYFLQGQTTVGEDQDSSWNPSHVGDGSAKLNDVSIGTTSVSEAGSITRLASIDSFDSKW